MSNKSKLQILRRPTNDGIQINVIKPTRQDWEEIKKDAARYLAELQAKVNSLTQRARQKIETIDPARRNQHTVAENLIHAKRWLPVVAGLGVVTVTGMMIAANKTKA
jgi:hypothetical protein